MDEREKGRREQRLFEMRPSNFTELPELVNNELHLARTLLAEINKVYFKNHGITKTLPSSLSSLFRPISFNFVL